MEKLQQAGHVIPWSLLEITCMCLVEDMQAQTLCRMIQYMSLMQVRDENKFILIMLKEEPFHSSS